MRLFAIKLVIAKADRSRKAQEMRRKRK